jgi:hypothetical protein
MMKKNLSVALSVFLLLTFIVPQLTFAKGKGSQQWFITPRIGTATLMSEVESGFTSVDNEFSHNMGFSMDITISKTLGTNFELGVGVGFYSLSSSDDSLTVMDLSVWSSSHEGFNGVAFYTNPIEYKTTAFTPSVLVRYYFKKFASRVRDAQLFQPYIELNAGPNILYSELAYTDVSGLPSDDPAFSIGKGFEPNKSPEVNLQYALGLGSRFNFKSGMTLTLAAEISKVSTDYLDGAPNYATTGTDSKIRQDLAGLVPRIMFGVAIPLNEGSTRGNQYLPWAP